LKPQQPYHLPVTPIDGKVREHLFTPIEPNAPIGLMLLGSLGPELLVKVATGWADLVDGHTFREGWALEDLALDLRHAGTAVAVAAEVVRRRGASSPIAMEAMAVGMRVACQPVEQRAGWAAKLVVIALRELASVEGS
jgi:hypothetical protein